MTRDEFRQRIAAMAAGASRAGMVVDSESFRFQGDEDGGVCFAFEYRVSYMPGESTGYLYVNTEELLELICDD